MQRRVAYVLVVAGGLGLLICLDMLAFAPLGDKALDWPFLSRPDARAILELLCGPFALALCVGAAWFARLPFLHSPHAGGLISIGGWAAQMWTDGDLSVVGPWLAVCIGVVAAFALPAWLGDPAPARAALALILGGAAAFAIVAARALTSKGETFEISSWEGGLGGGSRSLRLSRPLVYALIAIALAGASVGVVTMRPAADAPEPKTKEKPAQDSKPTEPAKTKAD